LASVEVTEFHTTDVYYLIVVVAIVVVMAEIQEMGEGGGENKRGNISIMLTVRHICASIVVVERQKVVHTLNVFVALGIQHAMRISQIVICSLFSSTIFFHVISQTAQFFETGY